MPYWNRQKHVFWSLKQQERRLDRKIAREAEEALLPEINAAFVSDTYLKNADATNFSTLFTHTRSGLATQYDSAGVLKWAPHNLLTYSEEFDDASWNKSGASAVTANAGTAPNSTETADEIYVPSSSSGVFKQTSGQPTNATFGWGVWVKGSAGEVVNVGINGDNSSYQQVTLDGTWQFASGDGVSPTDLGNINFHFRSDFPSPDGVVGEFTCLAWGAHFYRSDLGGMVNNPARGDSYVPTTSSAVYLPRRNAHYYDGSAWQKGVQIETEARTNLITYSVPASGDYSASGVTLSGGQLNPLTQNSDGVLVTASSGTSAHAVTYAAAFSAPTSITDVCSGVWIEKGTADYALLEVTGGAPAYSGEYVFDLNTGDIAQTLVGASGLVGAENQGSGVWRLFIVDEVDGDVGTPSLLVGPHDGTAGSSWAASGTETIKILAWQAEEGSTPSSYIPTAGSSVTRAADTLTIPAAQLPYSSEAMSFALEGLVTYSDNDQSVEVSFYQWGGPGDRIFTFLRTSAANLGRVVFQQQESSSTATTDLSGAYSPGINVPFNLASRHTSDELNGAVDGTALTADTTPTALPDLSTTDLDLASDFMGILTEFKMWDRGLSDAELESESA